MKKVYLGMFFGNDMNLEVKDDDEFDYVKAYEHWVEDIKQLAVQNYKDELFLKELDNRKPPKNNNPLSFLLGLLVGRIAQ